MLIRRLSKQYLTNHKHQDQQPDHTSWDGGSSAVVTAVANTPMMNPHQQQQQQPTYGVPSILRIVVVPNTETKAAAVQSTTSAATTARPTTIVYHTRSIASSNRSVHTTDSTIADSSTLLSQLQPPPPQVLKKTVSFQEVYIREYERILGDNPSCSSGAPISLGWNHAIDKSVPLDEYEERSSKSRQRHRQRGTGHPRSHHDAFILTRHDREVLLIEWGVSFNEMIDVIRTNVKIKNQRRRTVNAIGTYDRIEEIMEQTASKLKDKLKLKKSSVTGRGATLPPPPKTIPSQQRTRFHSNHLRRSRGTSSGRRNMNHDDLDSFRSNGSSGSSNGTSSVLGSDRVSISTTTNSTSNAAVCCPGYNRNTDNDSLSLNDVTTGSEANDFSTNIRTPASSIVAMNVTGCADGTTGTTTPTNIDANNTNIAPVAGGSPFDLDDEVEKARVIATKTQAKMNGGCCSKSLNEYQCQGNKKNKNNNNNNNCNKTKATGVTVPIIGVDIPRDVKLQRTLSIESVLTYDPMLQMINQDSDSSVDEENLDLEYYRSNISSKDDGYDYNAATEVSVSTMIFDTEHDNTDHHSMTMQEADHDDDVDGNMYERNSVDEMTEVEPTDYDDDMTISSKFMKEFSEFMMGDNHPSLIHKTMSRNDDSDDNDPVQDGANPTGSQPTETQHDIRPIQCVDQQAINSQLTSLPPLVVGAGCVTNDDTNTKYSASKSMTDEEYPEIFIQNTEPPLSPISEYTGGGRFHNSFSTKTSVSSSYTHRKAHPEDGDFDGLQRDSTFWEICPGEHDSPQIQRKIVPVVIMEDVSVGESALNRFDKIPKVLSGILEDQIHYSTNGQNVGYLRDKCVNTNTGGHHYPDMYSTCAMTPTNSFPTYNHQYQHHDSATLHSRHPLPATIPLNAAVGISLPDATASTMNYHPASFLQQQQLDPYTYSPVCYQPLDITGQSSVIPPELMYNIENGQPQYSNNNHPHEPQSYPHHHGCHNDLSHNNNYSDKTDVVGAANTQKWEQYGFRIEPPPNSTALLHKMMM